LNVEKKYFSKISSKVGKTGLFKRDSSEGVITPPPAVWEGGERLLELSPSQKKTVRHQFDNFCKKVLREEARDYIREIRRLADRETTFSELSEEQMNRLYAQDIYPSETYRFEVQGYHVAIQDGRLADALNALSDEQRDIVLLSYCLEMSDREIGERLNMVRSTVQYRRTSSITKMRERLEVKTDGGQTE
jgi:RNA polymerase sigma factor (sigma-70 family)